MKPERILSHEAPSLAGQFIGNRYFGGLSGGEAMQHLTRKYFNLLLLHDHYRSSVATAERLPKVNRAIGVVLERMEVAA